MASAAPFGSRHLEKRDEHFTCIHCTDSSMKWDLGGLPLRYLLGVSVAKCLDPACRIRRWHMNGDSSTNNATSWLSCTLGVKISSSGRLI